MVDFPSAPIEAEEFMREFLPRAFADAGVPEAVKDVELKLGVVLVGEGGGEWIVSVAAGSLRVESAPRDETAFTLVQTVEDWRGALWEGRGGVFGKQAAGLFRPGAAGTGPAGAAFGAAPSPAALAQMETLSGLIRMVVSGGEGGDWLVDFKLGPGAIPDDPSTVVTISADDAVAIESGALNPIEAFMAGRIQVAGDIALMMQMQAIAMQAGLGDGSGA